LPWLALALVFAKTDCKKIVFAKTAGEGSLESGHYGQGGDKLVRPNS